MKLHAQIPALLACAFFLFTTSACKKNKNVYADDLEVTIAENPADSTLLGKINATTEKSYITYTLISESPSGAFILDETTGNLYVKDKSLFNYEINPILTAVVEASNGKHEATSNVKITLNDVYEVPANVGDYRDGGVVFWVNPADNTKGMVCAIADQSSSNAEWGCWDLVSSVEINGADGTAIGTGAQNTEDIVAGCSSTSSGAYLCSNLSLGGYDDWFLPSRDEMTAIYNNKAIINAACVAHGGTNLDESVLYWTSSEFSADKAYDFYFADGVSEATLKLNLFSIRAVRSF